MDARLQLRVQRDGWDPAAGRYDESWQRPLSAARRWLTACGRAPASGCSTLPAAPAAWPAR